MATILIIKGWRIFFYSNEGNEPMHVHCRKAEMECKFWLNVDKFDIEPAYKNRVSRKAEKEIRQIIFQHFDYIVSEWRKIHGQGTK